MEDAAYYLSEGAITLAFLCAAARRLPVPDQPSDDPSRARRLS
jgi:hypothetical protein